MRISVLGPLLAAGIVVVGVGAYLLTKHGGQLLSSEPETPELVLGLMAPFSGPQARFGAEMKAGVGFAVDIINEGGGIGGRKVRLVEADSACDSNLALDAAKSLAEQKPAAVVGPFCSAAALAAQAVFGPRKIVMITPAATAPVLTDDAYAHGFDTVFRVVWRDDYQGRLIAALIKQTSASRRVAIIRDGTGYGAAIADAYRAAAAQLALKEPVADLALGGDIGPGAAAARIKAAKAQLVLVAAAPGTAGLVAKAFRDGKVAVRLIGPDALASEAFRSAAGDAADGVLVSFAKDPVDSTSAEKVVARLRAAGTDPAGYVLPGFAAAEVAIAGLGTLNLGPDDVVDGEALATALRSNRFNTVMGELVFDPKGDVKTPGFIFYVWSKGELTVM